MMPDSNILQAIPELESTIPAESFSMVTDFWLPVGIGLLIALLLAGIGLWIWKRRSLQTAAPLTPLQVALQALADFREAPPATLRECSLRVSMILRSFLAGQAQDPALFETHEEFSRRMDSLATVPVSCRHDMHRLLDELAEFKYAGATTQDAVRTAALADRATELVSRIAAAQAEEQKAAAPQPAPRA